MDMCKAFMISTCIIQDRFGLAIALATFTIHLHVYIIRFGVERLLLNGPDHFSRYVCP